MITFPSDPVFVISAPYDDRDFFQSLMILDGSNFFMAIRPAITDESIVKSFGDLTIDNNFIFCEAISSSFVLSEYLFFKLNIETIRAFACVSEKINVNEYCEDVFVFDENSILIDATGFCHEDMHVNYQIKDFSIRLAAELECCSRLVYQVYDR